MWNYVIAENIKNNLFFINELVGAHNNQKDFILYAKYNENIIGKINYVIFENKIYIQYIEVNKEHRRKGVGTALFNKLKEENPEIEIVHTNTTDEGDSWVKSVDPYYGKNSINKDKEDLKPFTQEEWDMAHNHYNSIDSEERKNKMRDMMNKMNDWDNAIHFGDDIDQSDKPKIVLFKNNNWYKISQEFTGSDGLGTGHIQDTKIRNFDSEYLPQDIKAPVNSLNQGAGLIVGNPCPVCGSLLEEFEFQGRFLDNGEQIYKCSNCGQTNDPYKRTVQKNKRRIRKRRARSNSIIKEAIGMSNSNLPGMNPANQPWGRLDLSDDQRIIPWNRIEDGFREEFDHQKQKKNFKYKLVKRKNEEGKIEFIRVRTKSTGGDDTVQPSNTFTDRGRVKKQPRYNPGKNRNKNKSDGSWPHNRNPGTEGWYGQGDTGNNLDADMKQRVIPWSDYISDRSSFMTNLTRPW